MFQAHSINPIMGIIGFIWILLGTGRIQCQEFRIPDGFEIAEVCSQSLAPDIYSMTLSPRGDLVVSSQGYVRVLKDRDGDGAIESFVTFIEGPEDGAMGMFWEGAAFFLTGEGGLWRYQDKNQDDIADGTGVLISPFRTGNEHGAHAIRRGPDGWLYVLSGNEGGVDSSFASTLTSPIEDPVGGTLVRFSPDLENSEIVADGFRNAYDFDFNSDGEIFVYDSDNERCVSLPFYEPTRLYHVTPRFHYGWENPQYARTWRMPPHFYDIDGPIATLGRGSPTGVVCYNHSSFPKVYRDGLFLADWTFGRIYFCRLDEAGSTYFSEPEIFVQSLGSNGFAPTDLAVHPETGDLLISIGGRGTRGAIYRVRYTGSETEAEEERHHAQVTHKRESLRTLTSPESRTFEKGPQNSLTLIHDHWGSPDRKIRQAVSHLIQGADPQNIQSLLDSDRPATSTLTLAWGIYRSQPETSGKLLVDTYNDLVSFQTKTDAARLLQVLLGDLMAKDAIGTVWEGYSRRGVSKIPDTLRDNLLKKFQKTFPSGNEPLDYEIARVFGMVESDDREMFQRILDLIRPESDPEDDVHYLAVIARLKTGRTQTDTQRIAEALLALDGKVEERGLNRERHWPQRLSEIYEALSEKDDDLNHTLLNHPLFGDPDHLAYVFTKRFPLRDAAEKWIELSENDPDFHWTSEMIPLVQALPSEQSTRILRNLWESPHLKEASLRALAQNPTEEDRDKFFEGLTSWNRETVAVSLRGLSTLSPPSLTGEWVSVLKGLEKLGAGDESDRMRRELIEYLEEFSGLESPGESAADWALALGKLDPNLSAGWSETLSLSEDWGKRVTRIDWSKGHPESGVEIYERVGCAACHTGHRTLGPDLSGVTQRFGVEDLMTAIVDPNRNISSQYQGLTIETRDGDLIQGLVVYKAKDSIILQNGPDSTLRVEGEDIQAEYPSNLSVMPTGLLDTLTDREIADLYSYLRSLN